MKTHILHKGILVTIGWILTMHHQVEGHVLFTPPVVPVLTQVPKSDIPKNVTELNLGGHMIVLQRGDFSDLNSLTSLNLSDNRLMNMEPEAFKNLSSLKNLNLRYNQLSKVPDLHHLLDSLIALYLGNNPIGMITNGSFLGFTNLEILQLSGCRLSAINPEDLSGLASLKELDLSGNLLTTLHLNLFKDLGTLLKLDLGRNMLKSLEPYIFQDLKSIKIINLKKSGMIQVPKFNLSTLEKLYIDGNKIKRFPNGTFEGATSLQALFLDENPLEEWPDLGPNKYNMISLTFRRGNLSLMPASATNSFHNLQNLSLSTSELNNLPCFINSKATLTNIKADENYIKVINPECLNNCTHLEELSLNENQIKTFPSVYLPSLIRLSIENNEVLGDFSRATMSLLPKLEHIFLSGNNLTYFPDFRDCPELIRINLYNNSISTLDETHLIGPTYLYSLNVAKNLLTKFPKFPVLTNLKILSLAENQISNIPLECLSNLRLWHLNMTYNKLITVPSIVNISTTLMFLHLAHNNIISIALHDLLLAPSPLSSTQAAEVVLLKLELQNNQIPEFPAEILQSLGNLEELNVSSNKLTKVPQLSYSNSLIRAWFRNNLIRDVNTVEWVNPASALTHLYLEDNHISEETIQTEGLWNMSLLLELHLERNYFKNFENISGINDRPFRLYLTGNPLVCDKELCWMRDWRITTTVSVQVAAPSCVEPEVHTTKTWNQLNIVNLACTGSYFELQDRGTSGRSTIFKANNKFLPPDNMNENATVAVNLEDCATHCTHQVAWCVGFYYTEVTLTSEPRNCQLYHKLYVYVEPTTQNITTENPMTTTP